VKGDSSLTSLLAVGSDENNGANAVSFCKFAALVSIRYLISVASKHCDHNRHKNLY
jgi:hypothetical protein